MATTFSFNLEETPLEGLRNVQKEIEKEIERRKRIERGKLIENFKSALLALQSAGVDVHCTDYDNEMDFRIYSWDDFYFN